MGARICLNNHIQVGMETWSDGALSQLGYKDLTGQTLDDIISNPRIKYIQISGYLPDEAYQVIDSILSKRQDITFRLFHFLQVEKIDVSFLLNMPHVKKLRVDCINLKNAQDRINLGALTKMNLKSLSVECFDLRDYSFIQNLSEELEELLIMADTTGAGVKFDCTWLLKYSNLHTLWLGKKAKKNLECISSLQNIKSLALRGIKINDFSFLSKMDLHKLALLWNSNEDLHELASLKSLKELELWRINKLSDVSFIEEMKELETIKLQDLKHVTSLPDLSKHKSLQRLYLIDTGIDIKKLPDYLQGKVSNWDF